jgi:ribosomal protein S18 acetylase RimI-like enzyme
VNVSDWRALSPAVTADLYEQERILWNQRLRWDTTSNWTTIETARVTWGLPGFVCHDAAGRIRGWTFYLVRDGAMDVGTFVSHDEAATASLVDALMTQARTHGGLHGFIYAQAPGLCRVLEGRGVATKPFLYLVRHLDDLTRSPADSDAPPSNDFSSGPPLCQDAAARLLQCAYGDSGTIFARSNQLSEWREYVANLIEQTACGVFSPSLSRAIAERADYRALAIVTALSETTAHLAQIAVDPSLRRRGIARAVLRDVLVHAHRERFTAVSLLVAADNEGARALYRSLDFSEGETFVSLTFGK